MSVKRYNMKIMLLHDLLSTVDKLRDDINSSYLELECTPSEESDYNILIDTSMCDLISNIEQYMENIEEDVYDNEIDNLDDENQFDTLDDY